MRVLIVDDDRIICRCLREGIHWEKLGCHEIDVCCNGAQALELIQEHRPNIIISDVKMPVMDGKELCRLIYEKFPDISFIFLSGYEDFVTAQLALRYHAKGYILKPLDRKSLEEVEELVKDISLQRENQEFIRRILRDEYRDYLENILNENNGKALEQFMEQLKECCEQRQFQYEDVWTHLLHPLFSYRYRGKQENVKYLFAMEQRTEKILSGLDAEKCFSFVKQQYREEMEKNGQPETENELVRQIQGIVREKYREPDFNVHMLGELLHMSSAYLGRIFTDQTGIKLVDHIARMRLDRACELLRTTKKSIKEIAGEVGYTDPGYFTKVFQQKMKIKPLEYRYGKQGEDEENV